MKSTIRLSAILLCLLLLAACSKPSPTPTDPTSRPTDSTATEPAPTEPLKLHDYESDALGLYCDLDERWEIAGLAKLGELSGVIAEAVTAEAMQRQFETSGAVYDFYATNSEGDSYVVTRENLALLPITDEDTFHHLIQRVLHSLDGLGIDQPSIEKCVVALAGKQYSGLEMHYEHESISFHQRVIVIMQNDTAWYLTVTSVGEDRTDAMLSVFQAQ